MIYINQGCISQKYCEPKLIVEAIATNVLNDQLLMMLLRNAAQDIPGG